MKKKYQIFFFVLLGLFVVSCKNFNNGSNIFEELDNIIEYINQDYLNVTIVALNSYTESINPPAGIYEEKYKKNDKIKIEFSIKPDYQFFEWKATPDNAVIFSDSKSLNTTVTIVDDEKPITIEPVVEERPKVITSIPNYELQGVDRASDIHIFFNNSMSEGSIYYTEEEKAEIKEKYADNKVFFITGERKNAEYAYYVEDINQIIQSDFKCVQIKFRTDNKESSTIKSYSYMHMFFGEPYFESNTDNYELVIPTIKNKNNIIPAYSEVSVLLKKEFYSLDKKVSLAEDYTFLYKLNAQFDIEPPVVFLDASDIKIDNGINTTNLINFALVYERGRATFHNSYTKKQILECSDLDELFEKVSYARKIVVKGGSYSDDGIISDIACILTPVKSNCFQNSEKLSEVRLSKRYFEIPTNDNPLVFDFSSYSLNGLYKVSFEVFDSVGKVTRIEGYGDNLGYFGFYTIFKTLVDINTNEITISDLKDVSTVIDR